MEVDCYKIRTVLKCIQKKRSSLNGKSEVLRAASSALQFGVAVCFKIMSWESEKLNLERLTRDTTGFVEACEIIMEKMKIISDQYDQIPDQNKKLKNAKDRYESRDVIISFYGDSNVGKSTLLNSIMGNRYLPTDKQTETAVSVHIEFTVPHQREAEEECEKTQMQFTEPLKREADEEHASCYLMVDESIKAVGQEKIKKYLSNINMDMRKQGCSGTHGKLTLKLQHALGSASSEREKFFLLDNPGCDEFGSDVVSKNVADAKIISAAFIYVTTFEGYKRMEGSNILKNFYTQNNDRKMHYRLTIVINKMDVTLEKQEYERTYTSEEVISNVHQFLCTKVFECTLQHFPKESIILVCGTWALNARLFYITSGRSNLEENIQKSITALKNTTLHILEVEPHKEDPMEAQVKVLEKYSNISLLEDRLQEMAKESFLLWEEKMILDITDGLKSLSKHVTKEKSSQTTRVADLKEKVPIFRKVFLKLQKCYCNIVDNDKLCRKKKPLRLRDEFKEAFERDKKEKNPEDLLLQDVRNAVDYLKNTAIKKIAAGNYKPKDFKKDLENDIEKLFKQMQQRMSSPENLSNVFVEKNTKVHMEIQSLKEGLASLQKRKEYNQSLLEPCTSIPKLSGPEVSAEIHIPLQLSYFQGFKMTIWKLFSWPLDFWDEPVMKLSSGNRLPKQSSNAVTIHHQKSNEFSDTQSFQKHYGKSNSKASSESSTAKREAGQLPIDEIREATHETSNTSEDLPDDCATDPKTSEQKFEKKESPQAASNLEYICYSEWSPQMELVMTTLTRDLENQIHEFFERSDETVIQICCEQYYDIAVHVLREFDSSEANTIETCESELEDMMKDLENRNEAIQQMTTHLKKLDYMLTVLTKFLRR